MKPTILKKILMAISLLLLITGCEDPKNVTIPRDLSTWESDEKFIKALKELPDEDKKLFIAFSMRTKLSEAFGGEGLKEGTTIGEAIDIQRSWQESRDNYGTANPPPPSDFHPTNDSAPSVEAPPKYAVKITSTKCPENFGGGFAEIYFTNIGPLTIPNAHVFMHFKDAKGGLIHAASAWTSPLSIPPGSSAVASFLKQGKGIPTCEIAAFQDGDGNRVEVH